MKLAANTQVILTSAKVFALAALCVAALFGTPAAVAATPLIADELRDPACTLGRAIFIGIGTLGVPWLDAAPVPALLILAAR